jgi:hypothetical protein
VFVGLDQFADVTGRMSAKRRYMLTRHGGMVHAIRGLVPHPADNRNARVPEDPKRLMHTAHYASELDLQDGIETTDDFL